MRDYRFRCSSLGRLMTDPTAAAIKAGEVLSVGAKTYLRSLAAQMIFGIDFEVSSKQMEKGRLVEEDGIALLNRVRGLSLTKNHERRQNDWITGEADLFDVAGRRGHDLKCSWSAATFPITVADCIDKDYEFQMRGYMWLWGADEWEVNYALVDTPESLIGYEPLQMHVVGHLPDHHRLTTWVVKRDLSIEERIREKVVAAREYLRSVLMEFDHTHRAEATAADSVPPWAEDAAGPGPAVAQHPSLEPSF